MDYHWPGNVRELENVTERMTVLVGEGDIELEDLPAQIQAEPIIQQWVPRVPSSGLDFNAVVGQFEKELIQQALNHTHWNKNRAAGLLGLNRTTLIEKIKKRGLSPPNKDA
jgi:DNA-binding NtrC family response regulator